jgi:hypothetical protein
MPAKKELKVGFRFETFALSSIFVFPGLIDELHLRLKREVLVL